MRAIVRQTYQQQKEWSRALMRRAARQWKPKKLPLKHLLRIPARNDNTNKETRSPCTCSPQARIRANACQLLGYRSGVQLVRLLSGILAAPRLHLPSLTANGRRVCLRDAPLRVKKRIESRCIAKPSGLRAIGVWPHYGAHRGHDRGLPQM